MMLKMKIYYITPSHTYAEFYVVANNIAAVEKYCSSVNREIKSLRVVAEDMAIIDDDGKVIQERNKI